MPSPSSTSPSLEEVRHAVELAIRAPSLHNSQPWRWVAAAGGLDLYADRSRQLSAVDPDGHGLLIGCGSALALARLGFAEQGYATTAERLPDVERPELLARVRVSAPCPVYPEVVEWGRAARRRRTDRRPFAPRPVAPELLLALANAAADDGVYLHVVDRLAERLQLAVAMSQANQAEERDGAYREELARWTGGDPDRAEGVPAAAITHLVGEEPRHSPIPLRDFELAVTGEQPVTGGTDENPVLAAILTDDNDGLASLLAGEALARLLVEAERLGLAAAPSTQALDWPVTRRRLRGLMAWTGEPQMIMRIGWPVPGERSQLTPRRSVDEVLET